MKRFLRISQHGAARAVVARAVVARAVVALAVVGIPLAASAQGGATLNGAPNTGLANRYVVVVGTDSTTFQKVEIAWVSPATRMVTPRSGMSVRSADSDRTGAASITFIRAVSAETQMTRAWAQRGTLAPVRVTVVGSDGSRSVMTAPSFKVDRWSINAMDAGASQVSIETFVVSTPALHVQGSGFGG